MRELGRGTKAAAIAVEGAFQSIERGRAGGVERGGGAAFGLERRQRFGESSILLGKVLALLAVYRGDLGEQIEKAGQPVAPVLREIRPAEERRALGRQEHRERPSSCAPREHSMRCLVDLVEIRALLAIDFDVHERVVHDARDLGIVERLVRHHVAPVTRGVTDREQDRLVPGAGRSQRFLTPRVPVDRIARVLPEVRARGPRETIGHARF